MHRAMTKLKKATALAAVGAATAAAAQHIITINRNASCVVYNEM